MKTAEIKTFIQAGRAVFTLTSEETNASFTYLLTRAPQRGAALAPLFASVLVAPDAYAYLGMVNDFGLRVTAASRFSETVPSFRALAWFLRQLNRADELPESVTFRHEGRCGRCARALTTPASIDTGLGPECAAILGVAHEARPHGAPSSVDADIAAYRATKAAQPHGGPSLQKVLAWRHAAYVGEPGEDESM